MSVERVSGTYITNFLSSEYFKSFIPKPLPPDPPINFSGEHYALIDKATLALGRLDGLTWQLPGDIISLYTYFYIRKEAVLSSQIEGTQSSLSDIILYENDEVPGVPIEDVGDVLQYVSALKHGLKRLREDNFPLSLRLIREIHEILLTSGQRYKFLDYYNPDLSFALLAHHRKQVFLYPQLPLLYHVCKTWI